jgi:hypothetical protein
VLEIVAAGGLVDVSGFPWQRSAPKPIGIRSLKANILCERHNHQLSSLDGVAKTFFTRVRDIAIEYNGKKEDGAAALLLNGHALERWTLKVLCGAVFSGNAGIGGEAITGWRVPPRWLRVLLGDESLDYPCGLYFFGEGETISSDPRFGFATIGPRDGLVGANVSLSGFRFFLAMEPVPVDVPTTDLKSTNHRLWSLRFASGSRERYILMGWPKEPGERDREVTINWSPPAKNVEAKSADKK